MEGPKFERTTLDRGAKLECKKGPGQISIKICPRPFFDLRYHKVLGRHCRIFMGDIDHFHYFDGKIHIKNKSWKSAYHQSQYGQLCYANLSRSLALPIILSLLQEGVPLPQPVNFDCSLIDHDREINHMVVSVCLFAGCSICLFVSALKAEQFLCLLN